MNEGITLDQSRPQAKKTRTWAIAGSIVIIGLLVSAAYLAGRLFKGSIQPPEGDMLVMDGGKEAVLSSKAFSVERAEELPTRPPDLVGMATRIENNSIYVGLSSSQVVIIKDVDKAEYDSIVEVVVARDTELYRDATPVQAPEADKLQQKVVPIALDDLSADRPHAQIVAWGERKGDRLIADVVLCNMLPTFGD